MKSQEKTYRHLRTVRDVGSIATNLAKTSQHIRARQCVVMDLEEIEETTCQRDTAPRKLSVVIQQQTKH